MSTIITYEGTLPGSRIKGELIERHADGSLTVEHPHGDGWTYRVRPEHIIAQEHRAFGIAAPAPIITAVEEVAL